MKTVIGKIFMEHFEAAAMFMVAERDFVHKNSIRLEERGC